MAADGALEPQIQTGETRLRNRFANPEVSPSAKADPQPLFPIKSEVAADETKPEPVDTGVGGEEAIQPSANLSVDAAETFQIPIVEEKHRGGHASRRQEPIHIPRYLKSKRPVDWNHLPPSSVHSRLIAEQEMGGVNAPLLLGWPIGVVKSPTSPIGLGSGNPSGVNSPRDTKDVNRAWGGALPPAITSQLPGGVNMPGGVNSPQAGPPTSGAGTSGQLEGANSHSKGYHRPILPAQLSGGTPVAGAQGMTHPPMMVHPQNLYTVSGSFPNLSFSPSLGVTPGAGQVVPVSFVPQPQQNMPSSGTNLSSPPMRRPPNMIGDVPKAKDAEKRRDRERVRRAIMANIISGLRNYGGYGLPPTSPDIEYIRALLREAGYVTHIDGTTYRRGAEPPVDVEQLTDAPTSSREDDGAGDTPPSTSMRSGDQAHSFQHKPRGPSKDGQPGEGDSRDRGLACEGTRKLTEYDNREAFHARGTGEEADRAPEEEDELTAEESEEALGKRLLEFVNGGPDSKKLRSS